MNIVLFGYGKMGKAIERLALQKGHQIVLKIDDEQDEVNFKNVDVAIDFSTPQTAYNNIYKCIDNDIPIICGTTGWLERYNEIVAVCKQKKGSFIYASNFSLGVNLFFELNKKLTKLMRNYSFYDVKIEEIHHLQKLDKPSGTAITLAQSILENISKKQWVLDKAKDTTDLLIKATRSKDVKGTHIIKYSSEIDEIEIKHIAKSRDGFALGAITAAEWLIDKKGVFTMQDVLFG